MQIFGPKYPPKCGSLGHTANGVSPSSDALDYAGLEHVDYGAYTGGYGEFGWYTDHPVLLNGH